MVFAKVKVPSIPIHQRLKSKSLSLMKRSLMKLLTVVKGMGSQEDSHLLQAIAAIKLLM